MNEKYEQVEQLGEISKEEALYYSMILWEKMIEVDAKEKRGYLMIFISLKGTHGNY